MTPQYINTKLEAHISESNRRHNELFMTMDGIRNLLETKVSYKNFTWIIGILVTILIAMFGYVSSQINDFRKESITGFISINQDIASVKSDVSSVKGKLEPYEAIFKN